MKKEVVFNIETLAEQIGLLHMLGDLGLKWCSGDPVTHMNGNHRPPMHLIVHPPFRYFSQGRGEHRDGLYLSEITSLDKLAEILGLGPPIMIGGHKVAFDAGGIQIGCTRVDRATILEIAGRFK